MLVKFKCNNCGKLFDENQLYIPMSGFGLLCGLCYQLDAKESYGDILGHND